MCISQGYTTCDVELYWPDTAFQLYLLHAFDGNDGYNLSNEMSSVAHKESIDGIVL